VAFVAKNVPSVGYDTYYLDFASESPGRAETDLKIDVARFEMENQHVKVPVKQFKNVTFGESSCSVRM
jgi:hypothetical protein